MTRPTLLMSAALSVLLLSGACDQRPPAGAPAAGPGPLGSPQTTSPAPGMAAPVVVPAEEPGALPVPPPPPGMPAIPQERFLVRCTGGPGAPAQLEIRLFPEQGVAVLVRDGRNFELQQQGDGTPGTRWTGEALTLVRTEAGWNLEQDGQPTLACTR